MLQINLKTSPQEIADYIKTLREQKGKEKETLEVINKALGFGHDFIIKLFFEEALTYQHMIMNDPADKKSISKMAEAVLMAKFYIETYDLKRWKSRLYRFQGRVSDYKGEFYKSVNFYKKAIPLAKYDPEPYRDLELKAFLSYSLIMSGKGNLGYEMAKKLFADFESSVNGKALKKSDYQAWAIWRSGIVIRTAGAFIFKRLSFDKKEFESWLNQAEEDLQKGSFSYRKMEIKSLKQKLSGV